MGKGILARVITYLMVIDLIIGTSAYILQTVNPRLTWIFIASLIVLFWLLAAKFFSILELFVYN